MSLLHLLLSLALPAAASGPLACGTKAVGTVLVVAPDPAQAKPWVELLREAGFSARTDETADRRAVESGEARPLPAADLYVILWRRGQKVPRAEFERFVGKKAIVVGEGGSEFLGGGDLVIGCPRCNHDDALPKRIAVPPLPKNGPLSGLLSHPCPVAMENGRELTAHAGPGKVDDAATNDDGKFPAGVLGLAHRAGEPHNWIVAKQGGFVVWGVETDFKTFTQEGRRFFVNLAQAMASAPSERLPRPALEPILPGAKKGVLKGGFRDRYAWPRMKAGRYRFTLSWECPSELTLIVHATEFGRRDGRSPLAVEVTEPGHGPAAEVEVGSFSLPEGGSCPYSLKFEIP